MAYSERIKNFNRIRDYMREFYVYGFKSRDEYTKKSARSYDDEKRRMESILGDYMRFRQTPEGKNVFLSIDSRVSHHNPLYKAWKTKSFTDGDILLHFILMDILSPDEEGMPLSEIADRITSYLPGSDRFFDESTIRKKLKEYTDEGIVRTEKRGKTAYYRRTENTDLSALGDVLDYFSEVAPCGVFGSFLLDKIGVHDEHFAFKHHYITASLDSEIVCRLFEAMGRKCSITLETINRHKDRISENHVIPLKIMISAQSGRQYLMAFVPRFDRITSFRTDHILSVKIDEPCGRFDEHRKTLCEMQKHMWGVSTQGRSGGRMEHVDFTVRYADNEPHIPRRLEREKRCGTVEQIDGNTVRFSADVFDAGEMIPWIRTFLCRIVDIHFSDAETGKLFRDDVRAMYAMYGIEEGGDGDAVQ